MPISWSEYGEDDASGDRQVLNYTIGYPLDISICELLTRFEIFYPEELDVHNDDAILIIFVKWYDLMYKHIKTSTIFNVKPLNISECP